MLLDFVKFHESFGKYCPELEQKLMVFSKIIFGKSLNKFHFVSFRLGPKPFNSHKSVT